MKRYVKRDVEVETTTEIGDLVGFETSDARKGTLVYVGLTGNLHAIVCDNGGLGAIFQKTSICLLKILSIVMPKFSASIGYVSLSTAFSFLIRTKNYTAGYPNSREGRT